MIGRNGELGVNLMQGTGREIGKEERAESEIDSFSEAGRVFGDRLCEMLAANSARMEDLEPQDGGGGDVG